VIDASQWAKRLQSQLRESVISDPNIGSGFLHRAEESFRKAQLDAIQQCLRLAQEQMNITSARFRDGIGPVVDQIADLAISVKRRLPPMQGDA
jgi:hypothetical protein